VIRLNRSALAIIALAFGFYHGLLGVFSLPEYKNPTFAVAAIAVYFVSLIILTLDKPGIRMRLPSALLSVVSSVAVSQLINTALDEVRQGSYTTWHVGALSTLFAIVAIRQHPAIAWVGFLVLATQLFAWGGWQGALNSGLIGALVLVAVAQAAHWAIISSANEAVEFRVRAVRTDSAVAAAAAARVERVKRLQEALNTALPLLQKIKSQNGNLDHSDRQEAALLEAELRDQIRGRALMSPEVVQTTRAARSRGVEVQLLDDGGLDDLTAAEREKYLFEISQRLGQVLAGKVVIRAAIGEGWRVTMAAIQKDSDRPDLFIRL